MFYKIFFLRSATLIKKKTLTNVFFCEFCEIFKNKFFTEHLHTTASASDMKVFEANNKDTRAALLYFFVISD